MLQLVAFVLLAISVSLSQAQCPAGWTMHANNCYIYIRESYNWFNAESTCHVLGGMLAEPQTQAENEYLSNLVHGNAANGSWIGAHDIAEEGVFVWASNNQKVEQTFWTTGQPDDGGHHQDCVLTAAYGSQGWADGNCERNSHHFVCQMPNGGGHIVG